MGSICSGEPRAVASRESPEAAGGKDGACIQDQLTFRGLKSKAFTKAMVYISVRKKKSSNTASVWKERHKIQVSRAVPYYPISFIYKDKAC